METLHFVDEKKKTHEPETMAVRCACGMVMTIEVPAISRVYEWMCADLECRRMYRFEYEGRVVDHARKVAAAG